MNPDVLRHLRCPVCGLPMASATPPVRAVRCPRGHNFDIARQGYVNLSTGRAVPAGDSADMVGARADFLAAGYYDFIATALAETAVRETRSLQTGPRERTRTDDTGEHPYPDLVVDAGAGTGWYLAAVLDALPAAVGLALDVERVDADDPLRELLVRARLA